MAPVSSDAAKILFLAFAYASCLMTMWTSPGGFELAGAGRVDLPRLRPTPSSLHKYCGDGESADEEKDRAKCVAAVSRAFQAVNLGGCAFEIQANALCEVEWCQSGSSQRKECEEECRQVRRNLERCVDRTVASRLGKNRKNDNSIKKEQRGRAADAAAASASLQQQAKKVEVEVED